MKRASSQTSALPHPAVKRTLWILLWILLWVLSLGSLGAEYLIRQLDHEHHYHFHHFTGFYAAVSFLSCAALVILAWILGFLLRVKPDYYQRRSADKRDA